MCKANCLLYKIPKKTQIDANIDANILLFLLYNRAFCINNPLHIQPSVEFNGKIFRMGQLCITQKHMSNEFFYCVCMQVAGALFLGLNGPT